MSWNKLEFLGIPRTLGIHFARVISTQILQYNFFVVKAAMFILLLEWLLIIFAIKFHVRDSQNARDQITSDTRSKHA